jgi:hypothetical protein
MSRITRATLEGVFPDRTMADKTVGELTQAGFRSDQVELTAGATAAAPNAHAVPPRLQVRGGAMLGGLLGALVGCLLGVWFGNSLNPINSSPAQASLVGALVGLVVLGGFGALIGWALAANAYNFYNRDLHPGRFLVTVRGDGDLTQAAEIMRHNRAVHIEEKQVEAPPAPVPHAS